jgi:uroporphyrinogen decarboxylase
MDPAVLFASPEAIEREAKCILESFGRGPGHVFNLGHGVSQFTPPEHVQALVEAVHRHSLGASKAGPLSSGKFSPK